VILPWTEMPLPAIADIRAFTFPMRGRSLVWTADGVLCLTLAPDARLRNVRSRQDVEESFDPATCTWGPERRPTLSWDGDEWFFHGENGGDIPIGELRTGERLEVDAEAEQLLITNARDGDILQRIDGFALSSGWAIAGFSEDGTYLIVCTPRRLRAFTRSPAST
jgi:hypothetical protein